MVRVAGLTEQAAAGLAVRSPDGRWPRRTLGRDPGARPRADRAPGTPLEARPAAGAGRGRRRRRQRRGLHGSRARGAPGRLREAALPDADAARGRPWPAVPLHLRAVAQPRRLRPRPEDGRGAVRPREGAGAPAALPAARQARPLPAARGRDPALPRPAVPEDGDRRVLRLPRHARRRLRGLRRGRRPARGGRARAAPPPLRRRGPARGLRLACRRACSSRLKRGLGVERRPDLPDAGPARPRRPARARRARAARPEGRAVGAGHPRAARDCGRRRARPSSPRSGAARSSSSTRTTRSRPASRASCAPPPTIPTSSA